MGSTTKNVQQCCHPWVYQHSNLRYANSGPLLNAPDLYRTGLAASAFFSSLGRCALFLPAGGKVCCHSFLVHLRRFLLLLWTALRRRHSNVFAGSG